jgi:hypothetical protein
MPVEGMPLDPVPVAPAPAARAAPAPVVSTSRLGDERRVVVLNFTDAPRRVALDGGVDGRVLLSTHFDRSGPVTGDVTLRPDEGVIVAVRERRLATRHPDS